LETKQHGNRATSFWEGWKQGNNWKQDKRQDINILEGQKVGNKVGNKATKVGNKDRKEEGNNIKQQVFGLGTRQQVLGLPRIGIRQQH
jgi:hypothetical protein